MSETIIKKYKDILDSEIVVWKSTYNTKQDPTSYPYLINFLKDIPEKYRIFKVTKIEYVDSNGLKDVKHDYALVTIGDKKLIYSGKDLSNYIVAKDIISFSGYIWLGFKLWKNKKLHIVEPDSVNKNWKEEILGRKEDV
jgi:hypothetical protein